MITEQKFLELKRAHETAKTEADRAEGALRQLMCQLKADFDCNTLEEAQEKLRKLQKQQERERKELETTVVEYEKKWTEEDV